MNEQAFDVMAQASDGTSLKLGRTWLSEKGGSFRFGFDLSSLPLPGAQVQLVSEAPWNRGGCPAEFTLKMPVEKKDDTVYWHPVGRVVASQGGQGAFNVFFSSIPTSGNLHAFPTDSK